MKKSLFQLLLNHRTAANLFLLLMIILGIYSSKVLNTIFPNYSIDYITINIEWPGASPKDVEEFVIKLVEEKVRYIDKVKYTKSTAKKV